MPMHRGARHRKCRANGRRQTAARGRSHDFRHHGLPPSRFAAAAGCLLQLVQQRSHFFLNGDDRLRLIQAASQSGILTIGLGKLGLQRVRRNLFRPALTRPQRTQSPASRWPRQSLKAEEYRPSRRRMAEIPPVSATRSVSARICSLYFAVKLRRFGPAVNSADATTDAADAGPSGEEGKEPGRRSGITMGSFSCALKCKLQTVKCLTLVGTEG